MACCLQFSAIPVIFGGIPEKPATGSLVPRPSLDLPAFNVARKSWEIEGGPGDKAKLRDCLDCIGYQSSFIDIDSRVLSIGGGRGEASPPKHPASPPKEKSSKRKREERERGREEVGNVYYLGTMIIHVNSIPLN